MDNDIETIEGIDAMVDNILGPEEPAREEKTYLKICANCGIQFRAQTRGIKLCPECRRAARSAAGRKGAQAAHGLKTEEPAQKQEIPQGMTRAQILDAAKAAVCGQREQDYGSPENSFQMIADLWTAYLVGSYQYHVILTPVDVAAMMSLMKIARIGGGRGTADSFVDLAGYAACGGEIATGGGNAEN